MNEYKKLAAIINRETILSLRDFFISESSQNVAAIEIILGGKRIKIEKIPTLKVSGDLPNSAEKEVMMFPFVFLMDDGSKDYKVLAIRTEDLGRLLTIEYDYNFKIMLDGKVRTYIAYLRADTYEIEITKLPEKELEE